MTPTTVEQIGNRNHKAYYIDYNGEKRPSNNEQHKTVEANTHIDYIFGKKGLIELKEICIDMRTLTFTDHCVLIADVQKMKL